jgi:hypothetical protein
MACQGGSEPHDALGQSAAVHDAAETPGLTMSGQSVPHLYFHRALGEVFGAGFAAGFVLDGFEEPAFPPHHPAGSTALSWSGQLSDIPAALVARMRKGVS